MHKLRFVLPILFVLVILAGLHVGVVSPVFAVKGSYPGVNGKTAYAAGGPGGVDAEIFVMNNDGTGTVQLTNNDVYDNSPCWSPDGTKIAFVHGDYPSRQIWVMDADGLNQRQLTTPPGGDGDYEPAWSPDGSRIAYGRASAIYVIDAAGPAGVGTLLISTDAMRPSWSPDGSEIAYDFAGTVYVADATTGALKRTLYTLGGSSPCWSPDGIKIVFQGLGQAIWVMNAADGSNLQQLSDGIGNDPNWSPDGTRILFWRPSDSIWVMNADGSNEYDLNPSLPYAIEPDYQRLPIPSVGGMVMPANPLVVLAPWLAVIGLVACISTVVVIAKRHR